MFDFEFHPIEEALAFSDRWAPFFSDVGPAVVAIKLDREGLDPDLLVPPMGRGVLPPAVERADDSPYVPMFIPRVEAWYRAPIAQRLFSEYVAFRRNSGYQHVRVPVGDDALSKIEELDCEWAAAEERDRQERLARGEIDLVAVLARRDDG